jgi:predicted transcriptional regulator
MSTGAANSSDHEAFKARLGECIAKFGNYNALAKASGIPQSTFHNYVGTGEPPRDKLIAIARAAGVNVGWLVAGQGKKTDGESEIAISLRPEEQAAFQARFDQIVGERGGIKAFANLTEIPLDRLSQVKAGGQLTVGEFNRIVDRTNLSLNWLIAGRGPAHPFDGFVGLAAGDEPDLGGPSPRPIAGQGESGFAETLEEAAERTKALQAIFRNLPKGRVIIFEIKDDTMKGDFEKGDLVVIDQSQPLTVSAVYLFESLRTKRQFLARAAFTDEGIICGYSNEFYNLNSRFTYRPETHQCFGRAVQRINPI